MSKIAHIEILSTIYEKMLVFRVKKALIEFKASKLDVLMAFKFKSIIEVIRFFITVWIRFILKIIIESCYEFDFLDSSDYNFKIRS